MTVDVHRYDQFDFDAREDALAAPPVKAPQPHARRSIRETHAILTASLVAQLRAKVGALLDRDGKLIDVEGLARDIAGNQAQAIAEDE